MRRARVLLLTLLPSASGAGGLLQALFAGGAAPTVQCPAGTFPWSTDWATSLVSGVAQAVGVPASTARGLASNLDVDTRAF